MTLDFMQIGKTDCDSTREKWQIYKSVIYQGWADSEVGEPKLMVLLAYCLVQDGWHRSQKKKKKNHHQLGGSSVECRIPRAWFTAMTSLLLYVAKVSAVMFNTSADFSPLKDEGCAGLVWPGCPRVVTTVDGRCIELNEHTIVDDQQT